MHCAIDSAYPLAQKLYALLADYIGQETGQHPQIQEVLDYTYLMGDSLPALLEKQAAHDEFLKNLTAGQLMHGLTDMRHHITLWLATNHSKNRRG